MTESGKLAVISISNFMKVLIGVSRKNNEGNIKEISNLTGLSYSTTTRLISRFENRERWVRIQRDIINPAKNQVRLTNKGQKVLTHVEMLVNEMGVDSTKDNFFDKLNKLK